MGTGAEKPGTPPDPAASPDLLQLALGIGDIAVWHWDHRTDLISYDERGAAILGLPPGVRQVPLDGLKDVAHPDDMAGQVAVELEAYTSGRKPVYEIDLRTRVQGEWRWLRGKGCATGRDAAGRPVWTTGTLTDVTDQKRREEEQRQAAVTAQRLDLVLRASRQGIWDWDIPANVFHANQTYDSMLGFPHQPGPRPLNRFVEYLHPDDIESTFAEVRRAHAPDGAEYRVEFRMKHAAGGYRWVQSWGKVVARDEAGNALRMMGVHIDIDDLRRETEERKRLESILYDAVNTIPQRVWWKDREGRFLGMNQAMLDDAGLTSMAEMRGRTDHDMPWREEAAEIIAEDQAVMESGEPRRNLVERIRSWQGQELWVRTNKLPLRDQGGRIIGTLGTFEDMTAEYRAQAQLREARDAAETANRAKSDFLARMSHEIRTPMNGILGMTQVALESAVTPFQRDCLEMVRASGEALLTIINDILDFSKIEAGQMKLHPTGFLVRQTIRRAVALLEARTREKQLLVEVMVDPGVPEALWGDELRLGQVLINLLGNAVKFTPAGGRILLSVESQGEQLRVSIADTGIGMTPEVLDQIFEPFQQADDSTTRRFGGTGLGLAISRQLVEMLGGSIAVVSQLDMGSTFTFTCAMAPYAGPVERLAAPEPAGVVEPHSGVLWPEMTVLVAEDNAVNLKLVQHLLEAQRCRVTVAANGLEALRQVQAGQFDLILMDCQMPVMNGWDATGMIREHETQSGGRRTPVVALTANAMEGDCETCLAAGMDDYLSKPIDRRLLQAVIERYRPAANALRESPGLAQVN